MLTLPPRQPRAKVCRGKLHFSGWQGFLNIQFKRFGHSWALSILLISPWDRQMTMESTFWLYLLGQTFSFLYYYMNNEKKESNVKIGNRKREERSYCCPWTHNSFNIRWNFLIFIFIVLPHLPKLCCNIPKWKKQ